MAIILYLSAQKEAGYSVTSVLEPVNEYAVGNKKWTKEGLRLSFTLWLVLTPSTLSPLTMCSNQLFNLFMETMSNSRAKLSLGCMIIVTHLTLGKQVNQSINQISIAPIFPA